MSGSKEKENDTMETSKLNGGNKATTRRPKLLFLAYLFPPAKAAGCVRTWNIATYLARFGWDVTVVTPHLAVWRNVEDCEKVSIELERMGIKRILTGHKWRCLVPEDLKSWNQNLGWVAGGICRNIARRLGVDKNVGWIKAAEQACSTLTSDDVDVILASGPPFGSFSLAKCLSERFGRPYVLDYRDPWTGNPHAGRLPSEAATNREANVLKSCAAVSIVSPSWSVLLDRRFHVGSKVQIVPNGYDPVEMAEVEPYDFGHCAFVYAGIFYPPKRVITPFLAALKLLKESVTEHDATWSFHYYGVDEGHIRGQADRYGLADRIVYHGRVPRREALSAVKGASLSVVITSVAEQETLEDKGIVTGKIFEAIGLGTPVLLIAPHGSDARTITESTGLVKSFTGTEVQGMVPFLTDIVRRNTPQPQNIELCSWTALSRSLDTLLRKSMTQIVSSHHD